MAFEYLLYRFFCKKNDKKRDDLIKEPTGVKSVLNIRYAPKKGKWHTLDAYSPEGVTGNLPLLVLVHGGGWIYGTKKLYHLYAKDMARRGFAVVCYNYVLAPRGRFPSQLRDLDLVMEWCGSHAKAYGFDLDNVFLVGDSAGAHDAAMYAAIMKNPEYRKNFEELSCPLAIKGLCLACGVYDTLGKREDKEESLLWKYCLPKNFDKHDPRFELISNINSAFPPSYLFSAEKDIPFVSTDNKTITARLEDVHVPYLYKIYTSKEGNLSHVFHCNINEEHAVKANDDQAEFIKEVVKGITHFSK